MYKCTFNHNPIISIHLLHQQITIHSGHSNRHRISLDLLLGHILAKRFAAVFLIRRFRDIRNEAAGHFERMYALFMVVVLAAQQFCGQSDLLIDCNLQPCRSLLSLCRHVRENAAPKICLVLSSSPLSPCPRKMPHLKYAASHPWSPYATKRGHASIATLSHFPCLSIPEDQPITATVSIGDDAKADFGKELGHRQQAER